MIVVAVVVAAVVIVVAVVVIDVEYSKPTETWPTSNLIRCRSKWPENNISRELLLFTIAVAAMVMGNSFEKSIFCNTVIGKKSYPKQT